MMESRKNSLSDLKTCRFCLSNDETVSSLYDKSGTPKKAVPLPVQIMTCVSVEVFPSDRMIQYICERCRFFMDTFYSFKQICRQADESVMQYVQNDESLEPIVWPAKLSKCYKLTNLSANIRRSKNTVAINSPLARNASSLEEESDEGEENVYNIKIGDGANDDSTCIKVFKTGDKLHITKDHPKLKNKKGFSPSVRQSRPSVGCLFPCKYCDKSFTKSHHCTRHMRLKHKGNTVSSRGPFGGQNAMNCDQCDETFSTQDDLIYHSAKHATENLTCPLCHEKFDHVEQVSAHIKTHVDGEEFMCDLCELVFTSKDKLDQHLTTSHEDELNQEQDLDDEESMDMDDGGTFEDDNIHIQEIGDDMIVEIKKPDEFITTQSDEAKNDSNIYEENEDSGAIYTELSTVDTLALEKVAANEKPVEKSLPVIKEGPKITEKILPKPVDKKGDSQTASILRKAEEIKRKAAQRPMEILSNVSIKSASVPKVSKPESTTSSAGASDKSLRLLEKELQELKRTNNQNKDSSEVKTPAKTMEVLRNKRPQLHTSTPKPRAAEEKKTSVSAKVVPVDKKLPERRVITKENKEPKEKEAKAINNNTSLKDEKEKDSKEQTPKPIAKNGSGDKSGTEAENVRRSSRSSKVKDYAKMVRDRMESSDDDSDDDDEEYKQAEKLENRNRIKKVTPKPKPPAPSAEVNSATPVVRKRGRPRKEPKEVVPPKVKKCNTEEVNESGNVTVEKDKTDQSPENKKPEADKKKDVPEENKEGSKKNNTEEPKANLVVSPSGHTLKKIPIKSLPPGIKPMPLPLGARSALGTGELSEMRIGTKVVKVQKIVMTKAEVEAMAKKGLVEMKDGTMVLKQGIKLQSTDATTLKTSFVGENEPDKESPSKKEKPTPTRCNVNEEA